MVKGYEPQGIASFPKEQSESILLSPRANTDFSFSVMTLDRQDRPDVKKGETYHYHKKDIYLKFTDSGQIQLKNSENELFTILVELVETLRDFSVTPTIFGNMKLVNPNPAKSFSSSIQKLETFLGQSTNSSRQPTPMQERNLSPGEQGLASEIKSELQKSQGKSIDETSAALSKAIITFLRSDKVLVTGTTPVDGAPEALVNGKLVIT